MKRIILQGGGYEAPTLELLDVAVEAGFTASTGGDIGDWGNGDTINPNDE